MVTFCVHTKRIHYIIQREVMAAIETLPHYTDYAILHVHVHVILHNLHNVVTSLLQPSPLCTCTEVCKVESM